MEIQLSIIFYLNVLPVEIITKGQMAKIDIDQIYQCAIVILLQIFEPHGYASLHQVSAETEVLDF